MIGNQTKICSTCKYKFSLNDFTKNKISLDGLDYDCKNCSRKKSSENHFKHKDQRNAYSREYYYKHKKARLLKAKLWKQKNKDRVSKYMNKYRKENYANLLERKRFNNAKRKSLKKNVGGTHTFQQWIEMKKDYNYTCPVCLKKEPEIFLTEDHVIPISQWNKYIKEYPNTSYKCNDIENIQPMCMPCNLWKFVKIMRFLHTKFINFLVT